jgi:hypothetical protein
VSEVEVVRLRPSQAAYGQAFDGKGAVGVPDALRRCLAVRVQQTVSKIGQEVSVESGTTDSSHFACRSCDFDPAWVFGAPGA